MMPETYLLYLVLQYTIKLNAQMFKLGPRMSLESNGLSYSSV